MDSGIEGFTTYMRGIKRFGCVILLLAFASVSRGQTETNIHSFDGFYVPNGALVQGSGRNLYGTTERGGANSQGMVYQVTPAGAFSTLYSFCSQTGCADGAGPLAPLMAASDGNLYGTTSQGGAFGDGTVFRITPAGALSVVYSFCALAHCADGASPGEGMVQGLDGSLYGSTTAGGTFGSGTIFKITASGTLTTIYNFCGQIDCGAVSGATSSLVQGSDGDLYGTTNNTIFRITSTGTLTTLHYFYCYLNSCPDGFGPSGLVEGADGSFYGTTYAGGAGASGTVFKITSTGVFTTLHDFCSPSCADGQYPRTALIPGGDNTFYGTTSDGAPGGALFSITPAGVLTTLYTFCSNKNGEGYCLDGSTPVGLVQATGQQFYVVATGGGALNYGAVSRISVRAGADSVALGQQADYLGLGKAGFTVWRPSTGYWYSIEANGTELSHSWGAATDIPIVGDYDGDGTSDLAVWRPSTAYWYIIGSASQSVIARPWGIVGDLPVAGDFDGDGKSDLAVWRPSTGEWLVNKSSDNTLVTQQWGAATDTPVVGDFDGDGKTDLAVWRSSTGYWYIWQSSNNQVVAQQWGASTDVPVTGDFDGDGVTDIAVYRPSTGYWYIVQSSNGQIVERPWGQSGDIPVPRDYDGDGKSDLAVWRPSTGYWYVIQSSNGQVVTQKWGAPTDVPLNSPAEPKP